MIPLTANGWAKLRIPLSPDELLAQLIQQNQQPKAIPFGPSLLSKPRSAEEISHWNSLKERVRHYLIRAVATEGDQSEFTADFWHDVLTITHSSVVGGNLANDPLRQHATWMFNPKDFQSTKSPVIVYLEREPKSIFTEIQIVKTGR